MASVEVVVCPQRFGGERLTSELDRRLHLAKSRQLGPEEELRVGVIRRERHRTAKLCFRSPPVKSVT